MMTDQRTYDRFMAKVLPEPNSGCWLWDGGASGGYGYFKHEGRHIGAHVFSHLAHHGEIPAGFVVHHKCNLPWCVNPDHLEAVTRSRNTLFRYAADDCSESPKPSWLVRLIEEIDHYALRTKSSYRQISLDAGLGVNFVSQLAAPFWKEPGFGAVVALCRVMGISLSKLDDQPTT